MGIILIILILIIAGTIIDKHMYGIIGNAGDAMRFVGIILGIVVVVMAIINQLTIANTLEQYKADKIKYELAVNNTNLSGNERSSVIDMVTADNSFITSAKVYKNSIWLNIFVPYEFLMLNTFDINKIPKAVNTISLEK